jgi:hypothetical protein
MATTSCLRVGFLIDSDGHDYDKITIKRVRGIGKCHILSNKKELYECLISPDRSNNL